MVNAPITLVVADDHPVVVDGIRYTLADTKEITVVGSAQTVAELYTILGQVNLDVLLLDLNFRGESSLKYLPRVRQLLPRVKVVIFSSYNLPSLVKSALSAGVDGYVLKDAPKSELLEALATVVGGKRYVSRALRGRNKLNGPEGEADKLRDNFLRKHNLSRRELDVIRLLVTGGTSKDIGERLFISPHTVQSHRKNILRKLGLHDKAGIVKFALDNGLV